MCLPRDGAVLAAFYSGIGDAILHGPVLIALRRALADRLVVTEMAGMELLALAPSLRGIRTVPSHFRKLHTCAPDELLTLLRDAGIGAVLNFRRDRVAAPREYERFARSLASAGILHRDACAAIDTSQQMHLHTKALATRFLRSLNISPGRSPVAWLRPFVDVVTPADPCPSVAAYLGASVPVKRLAIDFWRSTLRSVAAVHRRLLLIPGLSAEEVALADSVSTALSADRVEHVLFPPQTLTQLAQLVRGLSGVMTGDTFALPLAEALGVPVVSIHCATAARVYGVQSNANISLESPFYARCPDRNLVGNCEAWTRGCAHLTCQHQLNPAVAAKAADTVFVQ